MTMSFVGMIVQSAYCLKAFLVYRNSSTRTLPFAENIFMYAFVLLAYNIAKFPFGRDIELSLTSLAFVDAKNSEPLLTPVE